MYHIWSPRTEMLSQWNIIDYILMQIRNGKIGLRPIELSSHFRIPLKQMTDRIYKLVAYGLLRKKKVIENNKEITYYTLPNHRIRKLAGKSSIFEILPKSTIEKLKQMADKRGKEFIDEI